MRRMQLSFTTLGCPGWDLDRIADQAKACGYHGIELRTHADGNHCRPDLPAAEAAALAARFRDRGVAIQSVMGYTNFVGDDAFVAANQVLMRQLLPLAQALGSKHVRSFIGRLPAGSDHARWIPIVGRALAPLAREAADRGITIAIETHDDWTGHQHLRALIDAAGAPAGLGFVYDICNTIVAGNDWNSTWTALRDRVAYCHVKDVWKGADGKGSYVALGGGDIPWREILPTLRRDGFDGWLSFEWEKKWIPQLEEPERVFPHFVDRVTKMWEGRG